VETDQRVIARFILAGGLLVSFLEPAPAQEWAARFPRAPECQSEVRLSRTLDSNLKAAGRARLIVVPHLLGDTFPVTLGRAGLLPVTHQIPSGGLPRPPDSIPVALETDTYGPHVLYLWGKGLDRLIDTVVVRVGYTDTIVAWLRTFDDEYHNKYNCRPRGFRQAGQSACVTDSLQTTRMLEKAKRYAEPESQKTFRLPAFDSSQVALVRDEKKCLKAAQLYGEAGDPPRRVVVVRMGPLYMVYDPYEPLSAGEWNLYRLFDRRWRPLFDIMG
jgi:hypothetical protein